jgi:hypothetical protein
MAGCSTAGKKNSKVDLLTYEERKLACPEQEQLAPAEKKFMRADVALHTVSTTKTKRSTTA